MAISIQIFQFIYREMFLYAHWEYFGLIHVELCLMRVNILSLQVIIQQQLIDRQITYCQELTECNDVLHNGEFEFHVI